MASPCTSAPSTEPDPEHLKRLRRWCAAPALPGSAIIFAGASVDGTYTHDLLPLPYTWEAVARTAERVRKVQDYLEIPVAVENVSQLRGVSPPREMTEWEFLTEVVERADCGILLDVNNIYVSSVNHEFDPMDYVERRARRSRRADPHCRSFALRKVHPRHARSPGHRSRVEPLCARHRALRTDTDPARVGRPHPQLRRSPCAKPRRPSDIFTAIHWVPRSPNLRLRRSTSRGIGRHDAIHVP